MKFFGLVTRIASEAFSKGVLKAMAIPFSLIALVVSAKVQLPFWPVPMTMQTVALGISAISLPWYVGFTSCIGYLTIGAFGCPVLATKIGFFGPTFGYLMAFPIKSLIVSRYSSASSIIWSEVFVLLCGTLWLSYLIGSSAIWSGFLIFIPASVLKMGMTISVASHCRTFRSWIEK